MSELSQLYKTVLEDELGLVARIDEDDDVIFRHPEFGTFLIITHADTDPEYLKVLYPHFADTESLKMERNRVLELVNAANQRCKAVKFYVTDLEQACNVSVSVGAIIAGPDCLPDEHLLRAIMRRNISTLTSGSRTLRRMAREANGESEPA